MPMERYAIIFTFLISFVFVILSEPYFAKKLKKKGFLARDMYKRGKVYLPNKAGIMIVFASVMSIAITLLMFRIFNP